MKREDLVVGNSYKVFHEIVTKNLVIYDGRSILFKGMTNQSEVAILEYIDDYGASHVFTENIDDLICALTEYSNIRKRERYQVIITMEIISEDENENGTILEKSCVLSGEDLLEVLELKELLLKYKGLWTINDSSNTYCSDLYEEAPEKSFDILCKLIDDISTFHNLRITSIKWIPQSSFYNLEIVKGG